MGTLCHWVDSDSNAVVRVMGLLRQLTLTKFRASRRIQLGAFDKFQLDDYLMIFIIVR